jgi:hypothetical protein
MGAGCIRHSHCTLITTSFMHRPASGSHQHVQRILHLNTCDLHRAHAMQGCIQWARSVSRETPHPAAPNTAMHAPGTTISDSTTSSSTTPSLRLAHVFSAAVGEVVTRAADHVPLSGLVRHISSAHGDVCVGEFRALLQGLLRWVAWWELSTG